MFRKLSSIFHRIALSAVKRQRAGHKSIKPTIIFPRILACVCLIICANSYALDEIRMAKRLSPDPLQDKYMNAILFAAMEATYEEYGAYKISTDAPPVMRGRAYSALTKRKAINLYISPVNAALIDKVLVVPIPVRRGILSYRLALVHKNNADVFTNVTTLDELRKVRVGMYRASSTVKALNRQHFNTVESENHLSMFSMLEHQRFTYVMRGVHEIFNEVESKRTTIPNVIIAPDIAFKLYMPTVFYLSPWEKRLAERIEKGLLKTIASGKFYEIFNKYYLPFVRMAKLNERKIIEIPNTISNKIKFPDIPGLWFDPVEIQPLTKNHSTAFNRVLPPRKQTDFSHE